MTQQEIDSAVAKATGEDLAEIRGRGFSLASPDESNFDVEHDAECDDASPQVIDWDALELERNTRLMLQPLSVYRPVA